MYLYALGKEEVEFVSKSIGSNVNDIDRKIRKAINRVLDAHGRFYFDIDYYSTINEKGTRDLSGPFTKISVCVKPKDLKTVINQFVENAIKDSYKEKTLTKRRDNLRKKIRKKEISDKEGKKILEKEMDEEFLFGSSFFGGICTALAIQKILKNEMKPNDEIRKLQKHLELIAFEVAKKDGIKNLEGIKFKDDITKKVIEEFKKYLSENFGINISAVNGDKSNKTFNDVIIRDNIKKEIFKEDHNLILISEEFLNKTHVIYFNPKTREIADGDGGRIIAIPKEYDEIEFLKAYLSKEYPVRSGITVLSVEKKVSN